MLYWTGQELFANNTITGRSVVVGMLQPLTTKVESKATKGYPSKLSHPPLREMQNVLDFLDRGSGVQI